MRLDDEPDTLMNFEAAEILGVSDARIRQLCIDGLLPGAAKRGKFWFIPRASVEAFKENPPIRRRRKKQSGAGVGFRPALTMS